MSRAVKRPNRASVAAAVAETTSGAGATLLILTLMSASVASNKFCSASAMLERDLAMSGVSVCSVRPSHAGIGSKLITVG